MTWLKFEERVRERRRTRSLTSRSKMSDCWTWWESRCTSTIDNVQLPRFRCKRVQGLKRIDQAIEQDEVEDTVMDDGLLVLML